MPPAEYPWATWPVAGWVRADGVRRVDHISQAQVDGRVGVLAVGSNASPAVLARKLDELLADEVAIHPVRVSGMTIGHSAHVSTPGYIPAAPAARPGSWTEAVLTWLTPAQLARVDATEPNYRRRPLPAHVRVTTTGPASDFLCPPGLIAQTSGSGREGDPEAADPSVVPLHLYDSVHGVLARNRQVLTLRPQRDVLDWVNKHLPGPPLQPADLADPVLQEHLRAQFIQHGLRVESGLDREPPRAGPAS